MPALRVSAPPIPKTELEPSWRLVPLSVTLNRFAVPERLDVPLNVAVPAVAVSDPPTETFDEREKLLVVEIVPGTLSELKVIVPAPLIVLDAPVSEIVLFFEMNIPLTVRLPATVNEVFPVSVPVTVRLLNEIPLPLMVLDTPLMDTVPVLPVMCVNVPLPLVEKFSATTRFVAAAAVIPDPVTVKR